MNKKILWVVAMIILVTLVYHAPKIASALPWN